MPRRHDRRRLVRRSVVGRRPTGHQSMCGGFASEDGEAYVAWGSGVMGEEMSAAWAVGEAGTHTVLRTCCPYFGFSYCEERGSLRTSNFIKQRPHCTTLPSGSRVSLTHSVPIMCTRALSI